MAAFKVPRSAAWCVRFLLMVLLVLASVGARAQSIPPVPADNNYTQDYAGLLHEPDISHIAKVQRTAWTKHHTPIIVVTIPSMKVYGHDGAIEPFATQWFNAWGIGSMNSPRGANNGVLLLVSVGDRKARIELGADWGRRWDGYTQRIMESTIIPQFKRGNYSGGIAEGVDELAEMAALGPAATPPPPSLGRSVERFLTSPDPITPLSPMPRLVSFALMGLGLVMMAFSLLLPADSRKPLLIAGIVVFGLGFMLWVVLVLLGLVWRISRGDYGRGRRRPYGDSYSDGDGGGFSSGGGFGGGFSGGGGASGSW